MNISLQSNKKESYKTRWLTLFVWMISIAGIIFWVYLFYYMLAIFKMPEEAKYKALSWGVNISRRLTFLTISISSLYILIKAKHTQPILYFSLFFSFLSFAGSLSWLINNEALSENFRATANVIGGISIVLLVRFIQEFPVQLNNQNIKAAYVRSLPRKLFAPILLWFLKSYRVWVILLPLTLFISYLSMGSILVLICTILSLGYLYVQLRANKSVHKNRLYWLLWLLTLLLFSTVYSIVLTLFGSTTIIDTYLLPILGNLSFLFAFIMIVYFSDLVDAKFILQKTVIIGAIVFVFTFIFGVGEHFIIHQLSHFLHIDDVYIASIFACFIGMLFHPLKEKLTHWMKNWDKNNQHQERYHKLD